MKVKERSLGWEPALPAHESSFAINWAPRQGQNGS